MPEARRVLIAGCGNVLRGDDGFGIETLQRLESELATEPEEREGVTFYDAGIGGIHLIQELLGGYDALVILDAVERGAEPGSLFVIRPDLAALATPPAPEESVDLHQANPEKVLRMAAVLGVLPALGVWIVGCQPADCDELGSGLTPRVAARVGEAAAEVRRILAGLGAPPRTAEAGGVHASS